MRDGSVEPVEVEVHPDPLCQEILEQIREAEVLQTTDRTRPIFNRRTLVLMNELCLDLTYDCILTHAELVAGGTRWDRAWQASGIIPLGAVDLHRVHANLFPTVEAARLALKREPPKMGSNFKRDPIWILTPFNYRRVDQRGKPSRVLVDTARHADARVAVEGVLGPLEKFEVEFQPNTDQQPLPPEALFPGAMTVPPTTGLFTISTAAGLHLRELLGSAIFLLPVNPQPPPLGRFNSWRSPLAAEKLAA